VYFRQPKPWPAAEYVREYTDDLVMDPAIVDQQVRAPKRYRTAMHVRTAASAIEVDSLPAIREHSIVDQVH
jgi:hypothetical protein